jgi:hypothetical protein
MSAVNRYTVRHIRTAMNSRIRTQWPDEWEPAGCTTAPHQDAAVMFNPGGRAIRAPFWAMDGAAAHWWHRKPAQRFRSGLVTLSRRRQIGGG